MIKTKLSKEGYLISKKSLTKSKLTELLEELTVTPITHEYEKPGDPIPVYVNKVVDKENYIAVPRFYGIQKFGIPKDNTLGGETSKMKFKGTLRDYQENLVKQCHTHIKTHGGGLLSVGTGQGKTVMALKIACMLGLKTLVLVHKTFLQDQWIERAQQFTDAKIGLIRQDKIQVDGFDISIGMVQSITSREYDPTLFHKFGLVILDEAHHYPSRIFSQALQKTCPKYTFALSATPERADGLTKVLHWFIGDTIYKQKTMPNKHVIAKIFQYESTDAELFTEKQMWCKGQMVPSNTKMINNLVELKSRNDHLVQILNALRKTPERKVLVLSGRRGHLEFLKKEVDKLIEQDIKDGNLLKNEYNTYYYVGGMKQHALKEASDKGDMLFGTFDMAQEGLDIAKLNTVLLATPKKNVTQAVGRIMRKILEDGDIRPLIIDIYDQLSIYRSQGDKRQILYKKNKYLIQKYYLKDTQITPYDKYLQTAYNMTDAEIKEIRDTNKKLFYDPDYAKIFSMQTIDGDGEEQLDNEEIYEETEYIPPNLKKPDYDDYMF